jgi:hypothetical protein
MLRILSILFVLIANTNIYIQKKRAILTKFDKFLSKNILICIYLVIIAETFGTN